MKILVISSNLIGDNILSTGIIEHLHNIYPNSKFTFLIGPTASKIYDHLPSLEKLIKIKKKKFNLHWINMYLKTRSEKWDIIVDLRSSLLSYLLNTKKRYIFKKNTKLHHVDQLGKSFGFKGDKLCIYTSQSEDKKANENIHANFKYIVIFPGGNWIPKIWPINRYNELIIKIINNFKNIKFIFVGSHEEREKYFLKIQENISKDNFINLMGENLTLTSAYMKKSDLFIGNDSGLMHLAVASNLRTIGLFGPTNDTIYRPYGNKNIVIRTEERYELFQSKKINPAVSAMESLSSEEVFDKIKVLNLL